eukprot:2248314-Prymnesium_polylepis.1
MREKALTSAFVAYSAVRSLVKSARARSAMRGASASWIAHATRSSRSVRSALCAATAGRGG